MMQIKQDVGWDDTDGKAERIDWDSIKQKNSHRTVLAMAAHPEEGEEAKSQKLRHAFVAYWTSIIFSDVAKRAVYMIAALDKLSAEMDMTPRELAESIGVVHDEAVFDDEFYNAFHVLADLIAPFIDGDYTCCRDVFAKSAKVKAKGKGELNLPF